jgi:hypothetical protein
MPAYAGIKNCPKQQYPVKYQVSLYHILTMCAIDWKVIPLQQMALLSFPELQQQEFYYL